MAKLTIEEIKSFCIDIGGECVSESYMNMKSKLELVCPDCGEVFMRNFDNIKQRKNPLCSKCGRKGGAKKQAHNYKDIKQTINSINNCKLISTTYKNVDSLLDIECECGNHFKTSYYKFTKRGKQQCGECGIKLLKMAIATPIDTIQNMVDDAGYTLLDNELLGGDQRILAQCDSGHEEYWVNVVKFKRGQRCPHCYRSKGEEQVSLELDRLGLSYTQEHVYEDLLGIGGGLLRYDFLVAGEGEPFLIEYDGKQHFEVAFDNPETFRRTQIHDRMKNDYAKNNEIVLYRIPYTDYDNISEIIQDIKNQQVQDIV